MSDPSRADGRNHLADFHTYRSHSMHWHGRIGI